MILIKECNKNEIGNKGMGRNGKRDIVSNLVLEFLNNGYECAEVLFENEYANGNNLRRSIQSAIEVKGYKNVNVTIRGDRVFLVRKDM